MLHVFFGSDAIAVRTSAYAFLRPYEERGIEIERVEPEGYVPGTLKDCAKALSLFHAERVVMIDSLSENSEAFEDVLQYAELLGESSTVFVLVERELASPEKKQLEKYAAGCVEKKSAKTERFSPFGLSEALLRRDKKLLWMLLMEARRNGLSDEEILGTLYWQVKVLRLAERAASAEIAGLKPFVYSKAKRALSKFKVGELDTLSKDLLSLYHDGHEGKRDLDIALEAWTLSL